MAEEAMVLAPGTEAHVAAWQLRRIARGLPEGEDLGAPLIADGDDIITTTGRWTRQGFRVFRAVTLDPEGPHRLTALTCWHFRRLVAWDILID